MTKGVQVGLIWDEESGFNAIGNGELLGSFGMRMDVLQND